MKSKKDKKLQEPPKKKRVLKCTECGSKEGEIVTDPYLEDITGETVKVVLCSECYSNRVDEI